ncbi:hypothetical protein ADL12_23785 [Streptomyces regalis]|uniref:Uncharacterized protein n=1 Tax=Streptomyces regalis TaxID=68262 RepID=A0A101JT43_9ACTN|nr:hypothetical protein ADL12_23785 [Streptomyces regalis]
MIAGRGNHVFTVTEDECGRGDVLQAAFAGVLFTSTGQESGQLIVAAHHLLDSGASLRRQEVGAVEIEEGRRTKYVEDGQHLTQAVLVDELLIGQRA